MSREIKFRAWLPNTGKMTYSHALDELLGWNVKEPHAGTAIWEQYTGLKDKNEKEIYEGDILKMHSGRITEVVFYNGGYKWIIDGDKTPLYNAIANKCEVIGNIYENPELLEKELTSAN